MQIHWWIKRELWGLQPSPPVKSQKIGREKSVLKWGKKQKKWKKRREVLLYNMYLLIWMIFHVNKHEKFQNFHSKPPLSPQSSVPFEKILDPRLRHTYILVSYQKKKPPDESISQRYNEKWWQLCFQLISW